VDVPPLRLSSKKVISEGPNCSALFLYAVAISREARGIPVLQSLTSNSNVYARIAAFESTELAQQFLNVPRCSVLTGGDLRRR
jgi:hypothetical protein